LPTATIQVAAVTSPDQWTLWTGADKVVAVNAPDDDSTTLIYANFVGLGQRYSLAANTIPSGSVINSVSVYTRISGFGPPIGSVFASLVLGVAVSNGPTNVPTGLPPVWDSFTDLIARPGGGSWSLSDFSTLQVQVTAPANQPACTSLWVSVDYTPPANTGDFFKLF
jgi:hypothetical protein